MKDPDDGWSDQKQSSKIPISQKMEVSAKWLAIRARGFEIALTWFIVSNGFF